MDHLDGSSKGRVTGDMYEWRAGLDPHSNDRSSIRDYGAAVTMHSMGNMGILPNMGEWHTHNDLF
jgi:hypothetical protein